MRNYSHPVIEKEEIDAVTEVLKTGNLSGFTASQAGHLGGKKVLELEDAFCDYFNIKYAVAMNSATACLHAAVVALGLKGNVICSPYTFSSSASCCLMAGADPKFVDIDEDTFCMNVSMIPYASGIIPVHLCGQPADMDSVMAWGLPVIEDAAQAIGAKYKGRYVGTIGDCGIFSFNQSKHISTGEGGILITDNEGLAEAVREIRNHGEVAVEGRLGWNYRMGEMEAALALVQFKKLESRNQRRLELTGLMTEALSQIEGVIPPKVREGCTHVYYTYAVRFLKPRRDDFQDKLIDRGVYFGKGYVKPLYHLPIYNGDPEDFPVAERMWKEELMVTDKLRYPATKQDVLRDIEIIKEVISAY